MKIVATSDTHEKHGGLIVPDGDVFIHAGDFTMIGEPERISAFNVWLGRLPHKHKIVIAGNHDRTLDSEGCSHEELRDFGQSRITNAIYLCHSGVEIDGKKFWGSPYTPWFGDYWKFSYDRVVQGFWDTIPKKLDVLITHGPPMKHLDRTLEGEYAGCYDLFRVIRDMHETDDQPRYHIFGHIHEGYGIDERAADSGRTVMMNVSAVDRQYRLRENPCVVFEV